MLMRALDGRHILPYLALLFIKYNLYSTLSCYARIFNHISYNRVILVITFIPGDVSYKIIKKIALVFFLNVGLVYVL